MLLVVLYPLVCGLFHGVYCGGLWLRCLRACTWVCGVFAVAAAIPIVLAFFSDRRVFLGSPATEGGGCSTRVCFEIVDGVNVRLGFFV